MRTRAYFEIARQFQIALQVPNLTVDSESHDSLDNINQILIHQQRWTVGLLLVQ